MQSKKVVFFLLLMIVSVGLFTFIKNRFYSTPKVKTGVVLPTEIKEIPEVKKEEFKLNRVDCYLDAKARTDLTADQAVELCKGN